MVFSQPAICWGDHRCFSFLPTMALRAVLVASLHVLGRVARDHARWSAGAARYRWRPPCAVTSRLIVDGARPSPAAIARSDRPAARPREISSRSAKPVSYTHLRAHET